MINDEIQMERVTQKILTLLRWSVSQYKRTGARGLLRTGTAYIIRAASVHQLYIHVLLDIIGVVERTDLKQHYKSWKFDQESEIEISPPIYNGRTPSDVPSRLTENTGTYHREAPFVSEVDDVILIGQKAIPVTDQGIILEAFSSRRDRLEGHLLNNACEIATLLNIKNNQSASPKKEFDTICSFAGIGPGYCGWIQTTLTRLQGLAYYTEQTGTKPQILLPQNPSEWMIDSLEFFGFTHDDWIIWDGGIVLVNNFIVPSVRTGEYTGSYYSRELTRDDSLRVVHPGSCNWLREQAFEQLSNEIRENEYTILYISRQNASKRRVENWEETKKVLEQYGVKIREMEKSSFEEQVHEIKNADIIIAPHGAGLVNTIFADNVTVIELFGSKIKSTYFLLSSILGHPYQYLLCQPQEDDLIVDTQELDELIQSVV